MRSSASPRRSRGLPVYAGILGLLLAPSPVTAIDFLEGRVQVHGYGETQIRAIATDFEPDQLDLTQWYLIGNVEIELDIAPEGWGPIDLLGAFVRVEARYDCVWTEACGLFRSVNTYGNQAQRLPNRLSDAHKSTFRGTLSPSAVQTMMDDKAGRLVGGA